MCSDVALIFKCLKELFIKMSTFKMYVTFLKQKLLDKGRRIFFVFSKPILEKFTDNYDAAGGQTHILFTQTRSCPLK